MSEMREEVLEEQEELEDVAIFDDTSAEMLLKRIREADEQYERMEAWYDRQKEKAKALHDRTVEWAERCLRAYFEYLPVKKTKTQMSYELPSGKLVLKAQQPEYERSDETLIPWLKENKPEFIKIKESTDWMELKKVLQIGPDGTTMCTEDGEVVPGIKVEPREPKFTVTVNKKER